MLLLQFRLLLLQIIDLVAIRIGLGDLRQVQKPQQARQYDQHYGVTDRPEPFIGHPEANRVLAAGHTCVGRARRHLLSA